MTSYLCAYCRVPLRPISRRRMRCLKCGRVYVPAPDLYCADGAMAIRATGALSPSPTPERVDLAAVPAEKPRNS